MRSIIGCVALLALSVGAVAEARPPGPPPLHIVILEQADELGISDAQADALEAAAEAHKAGADAAHQAMRVAMEFGDGNAVAAAEAGLEQLRATMEAELEAVLGTETWQRVQAELPPPPPRDGRPPGAERGRDQAR